jgi:DNA-binding NarL/FixJ family response regulator
MSISVVIADDHPLMREGLQMILDSYNEFEVLSIVANGKELVDAVVQFKPDIVLTDIVMPVMDGIEATRQIRQLSPVTHVIALSMYNEEAQVKEILQAGALGFLVKNADKEEIRDAIITVNYGKSYYCKTISTSLKDCLVGMSAAKEKRKFSDTDMDIIRLICMEKTNKEIADMLSLSKRTIEGHRLRIQEKMEVHSTAGIVKYAMKHKLFKE